MTSSVLSIDAPNISKWLEKIFLRNFKKRPIRVIVDFLILTDQNLKNRIIIIQIFDNPGLNSFSERERKSVKKSYKYNYKR